MIDPSLSGEWFRDDYHDYGTLSLTKRLPDGSGWDTSQVIDTYAASPSISGEQMVYVRFNPERYNCHFKTSGSSTDDDCYDLVVYDLAAETTTIVEHSIDTVRWPSIDKGIIAVGCDV